MQMRDSPVSQQAMISGRYLDWDFFRSFKWVLYLLKDCVTLFFVNETDNGTQGSMNLITHLNLVPSCCEILKMS
jgi:hypothetical protein